MKTNQSVIAKNTLALYGRMLFSMLVSLYTSRVILNTLGVEDYGIYNVVSGIIVMFKTINAALSTGTQRFFTFELGKRDYLILNKIFSFSLNIHIVLAVIILILAETVGLWFLNNKMVIAESRIVAANWVYQASVFSAMISITQVPYSSAIVAHEHFKIYAFVGIIEVVARLLSVFLLVIVNHDKLILLALFTLIISNGVIIYYRFYCIRNFKECTYKFYKEKELYKSLLSFSGWSFLGNSSHVLVTEGMNIVTNLFFGVSVNAARGIARQVEGAIKQFSVNFQVAMDPQITKNYAAKNIKEMTLLMQRGARFSYFLLWLLCLPILLDTRYILFLWLNIVPEYTVIFVRLNLIILLVYSLSNTYLTGILSSGNIKYYQILVSLVVSLVFGLTYWALKLGAGPEVTYLGYLIVAFFVLAFRLFIIKKEIGLKLDDVFKNVLSRVALVTIASLPLPLLIYFQFPQTFLRLVLILLSSTLSILFFIYVLGITASEKIKLKDIIVDKLNLKKY